MRIEALGKTQTVGCCGNNAAEKQSEQVTQQLDQLFNVGYCGCNISSRYYSTPVVTVETPKPILTKSPRLPIIDFPLTNSNPVLNPVGPALNPNLPGLSQSPPINTGVVLTSATPPSSTTVITTTATPNALAGSVQSLLRVKGGKIYTGGQKPYAVPLVLITSNSRRSVARATKAILSGCPCTTGIGSTGINIADQGGVAQAATDLVKRAACKSGCALKHPFNRSRREQCLCMCTKTNGGSTGIDCAGKYGIDVSTPQQVNYSQPQINSSSSSSSSVLPALAVGALALKFLI